jgi:DNA-binding transcriptional MerR regulator
MKIGEMAKRSGIAASRIRFYEAQGLLEPAQRQSNGYREYDPDTLTRLEIISRAQSAGFSLDEIRAILPPDLNAWPHDALIQALRDKAEEIEQLERRLAQTKTQLLALAGEIENRVEGEDCADAAKRVLGTMRQDGRVQGAVKGPSSGRHVRRP